MKRYTQRQISEAISFWKKILENKSPLLDDLVDEYGYGIVFHDVPVNFTLHLFDVLFDKINHHLFSDKLVKWPFKIDNPECCIANALCGYVPDLISNVELQRYDVVKEKIMIDGILFVPPHYSFSTTLINSHNCSLALAASLFAHEMIHQYNYEHEDCGQQEQIAKATGKEYDPHGQNFKYWMDKANSELGLHVQISGLGPISTLSKDAVDAMNAFAGQDYANESEQSNIYGHKILKHTKDFSAFTIFM